MAELKAGSIFAGHRIDAVAGSGGMGIVYRATHLTLEVTVALKVIAPQFANDPGFRERFQRESRLAASIEHPNVVQVRHAGEEDGLLYITMRYVDGTDMRAMIEERGGLDPAEAAEIVAQIAAALDAAHARGLVHRDVKPANVLIEENTGAPRAFLTDFGLTRHTTSQGGLTRTGQWVGTLDYVAPEQIEGKPVDAHADIYALCCVLYHALTGEVPFPRNSEVATMFAHLNDPPPELGDHIPGVAPEFEVVIKRAMAKKPRDRYPSAGDLGRAALTAAGAQVARPPERSVATGAAAAETSPPTARKAGGVDPQMTTASPTPAKVDKLAATRASAESSGGEGPIPGPPVRKGFPGGRVALIALGVGAAVAIVGVALIVAGVFAGGAKTVDYPAEARVVMTRFERIVADKDQAGLQRLLAPGARYHYLADRPDAAIKEYGLLFKNIAISGYSLKTKSLTASPDGVVTVDASYNYTDKNGNPPTPLSGELNLTLKPDSASHALKITDVVATPKLLEKIHVIGAPVFATCTARLGGVGGPVVSKVTASFRHNGRSQPLFLPLSASGAETLRANDTVHVVCAGHGRTGPFRFTDSNVRSPYAS